MSEDRLRLLIGLSVLSVILGATGTGLVLRGCPAPAPTIVQEPSGIDAGPGEAEIAARLDGAVSADEAEIRALEDRNARALAAFDEEERAEYERVRRGGRRDVARWLSDFNTRLKTDAGSP